MRKRAGFNYIEHEGIKLGKLYETLIFKQEGNKITLNSGGWRTNHTKNCMNDVLPSGYCVYQKNYEWFIKCPGEIVLPFVDGVELTLSEVAND